MYISKKKYKYNQREVVKDFHFGSMLVTKMKQDKLGCTRVASLLGRHRNTIRGYRKNKSVQAAIILELCHALKHNFFMDLALSLPQDFTGSMIPVDNAAQISGLQAQVAEQAEKLKGQEQELTILKAEKELLMKLQGLG